MDPLVGGGVRWSAVCDEGDSDPAYERLAMKVRTEDTSNAIVAVEEAAACPVIATIGIGGFSVDQSLAIGRALDPIGCDCEDGAPGEITLSVEGAEVLLRAGAKSPSGATVGEGSCAPVPLADPASGEAKALRRAVVDILETWRRRAPDGELDAEWVDYLRGLGRRTGRRDILTRMCGPFFRTVAEKLELLMDALRDREWDRARSAAHAIAGAASNVGASRLRASAKGVEASAAEARDGGAELREDDPSVIALQQAACATAAHVRRLIVDDEASS